MLGFKPCWKLLPSNQTHRPRTTRIRCLGNESNNSGSICQLSMNFNFKQAECAQRLKPKHKSMLSSSIQYLDSPTACRWISWQAHICCNIERRVCCRLFNGARRNLDTAVVYEHIPCSLTLDEVYISQRPAELRVHIRAIDLPHQTSCSKSCN
jgi:hypothetical protein